MSSKKTAYSFLTTLLKNAIDFLLQLLINIIIKSNFKTNIDGLSIS